MKDIPWTSLVAAVVCVAGSLWLSMGMGLLACPLCYYQRSFVMGAMAVLLVGTVSGAADKSSLMALPVALAGAIIGAQHVRLEWTGKMECPLGLFGAGTAPQQAFAAQALLVLSLLWDVFGGKVSGLLAAVAGIALAPVLAVACLASVAMPPKPPKEAYDNAPITCRPPNPYLAKE